MRAGAPARRADPDAFVARVEARFGHVLYGGEDVRVRGVEPFEFALDRIDWGRRVAVRRSAASSTMFTSSMDRHMIDATLLETISARARHDGVEQFVVGAVVEHHARVLLLQRPADDFMGGIFELPSGKVDPGEPLDIALIREVEEETGLTVTGIRSYLGTFDYRSSSGKKSRQFNFVVDIAAPDPITLTEHDSARWVSPTEDAPVTDAVKFVLHNYTRQET
jgi:8-oxo-dGTP diphosphatase